MDELEFWAEVDLLFHAAMYEVVADRMFGWCSTHPCEGCDFELYGDLL